MASWTVTSPNLVQSCSMQAIRSPRARVISPELADSVPATIRMNVDLPLPFRPTSATRSSA